MNLINKTGEKIKKISEGKSTGILMRLFTAWIITSVFFLVLNKENFTVFEFYDSINVMLFLILVAVLWTSLCFIKSEKVVSAVMVTVSGLYCILGARACYDFYFLVGCCGIFSGIVFFARLEGIKVKLSKSLLWIGVCVLMLGFTVVIGVTCCLRYNNYWTPCYDFGIFSQMFYYMKETGMALVTCERDCLLSHFAVHFSPVFYLLLPIYMIFPTPLTLMIGQCALTASGVVPLIKICRNHGLTNLSSFVFGACYILYPAMAGGCNYYIHENNFLAPLILWMILFMEKDNKLMSLVFGLGVLLVKEDAAVYVAAASLYFIFAHKNYKCSVMLFFISVAYFIGVTGYLSAYGDGVMTNRYDNYIYDDGGLFTVIKSVIQNPIYAVQQCFAEQKIKYILQMLVPLMFMPVCTKRTSRLLLLIPFILVNLMTNYKYQYDIMFQYGMGSGSMLIYAAVINFGDMGKKRKKLLLCSVLSSAVIFTGTFRGWLMYYKSYDDYSRQREVLDYAVSLVPEDASVASGTFILSNLSQRRKLYQLETTKNAAEFYVLDLRYEHDEYSVDDYQTDEFEEIFYSEDIVAVFKRK